MEWQGRGARSRRVRVVTIPGSAETRGAEVGGGQQPPRGGATLLSEDGAPTSGSATGRQRAQALAVPRNISPKGAEDPHGRQRLWESPRAAALRLANVPPSGDSTRIGTAGVVHTSLSGVKSYDWGKMN